MWVSPFLGLPLSLVAHLSLINALTSRLDGEEGVCMGIMGAGSSRSYFSPSQPFLLLSSYPQSTP